MFASHSLFPRGKASALSVLFCLAGGAAIAADAVAPATTEPVIVTATREPQAMADVPNSVARLDAASLFQKQPRTLPEALTESPGVLVQKTGHGQGSPYVRGFTGYRNLALIDGIRLNNSVFRDGPNQYWSTIDTTALESIELVKGQGSVLYGSDAIGGTLNALTLRPQYAETGAEAGGRTLGRWSSAENSLTGRGELSYSEAGKFGVLLGSSLKSYGDLEAAGLGTLPHTGYDEWDADLKFEWLVNPAARLTLFHQQVHQDDAWRTHATRYAVPWHGTTVGTDRERVFDQDRWLTYAKLEGTGTTWFDSYELCVSHQRQSEEEDRLRADRKRNVQGFDVDTGGAYLQFGSESAIGHLTYGASYYGDWIDSAREDFKADGSLSARRIQGPVGDDSRYDLAGAFLQDRIDFGTRTQIWLGGRFDYARADIGRMEDPASGKAVGYEDDWTNLSGSARFLTKLDDAGNWSVFGGSATGFRAPNVSDLSRLDGARSNEIETPSPGLDPENYLNNEIGLRHRGQAIEASAAYFLTLMDGQITGVRTGRQIDGMHEITKVNASDGFVQGIEAEASWQIAEQWKLHGWVAWQDGQTEAPATLGGPSLTQPVSRLFPLGAELGLRHDSASGRWWAEVLLEAVSDATRLTERDRSDTQRIPPGGTPGYCLASLRGGVKITEGFHLVGALENLTDEEYRVHGSGINGGGRGVTLSAEWRF